MTILITGGAGYIGSHTANYLNKLGYDFVIYDNLSTGHKQAIQGFPLIKGDIFDKELLSKTLKSFSITGVIHFAAFSLVGESMIDPHKYYKNNVTGTINLLEVMSENQINDIVFSSSAAVYGESNSSPLSEESELKPNSIYGKTKLMIEEILKDYSNAYDLRYVALRYFNACGADDAGNIGEDHWPETHLIPLAIKTALGQRPQIHIYGDDYPTKDGTCIRDYIHVNDLAQAHLLALEYLKNCNASTIFNLGNGNGFSVKDVIISVQEVTGREIPWAISNRRPGDPTVLLANSEKAKRELGWEAKYSNLNHIIKTAWKWHSKNPNGYSTEYKA